jgi:hypothetical protein
LTAQEVVTRFLFLCPAAFTRKHEAGISTAHTIMIIYFSPIAYSVIVGGKVF